MGVKYERQPENVFKEGNMLEGLKNWLREQSERQDYIDDMTFRYPSLRVQLLIIAAGCALYALSI
jgi:hypothetical protein